MSYVNGTPLSQQVVGIANNETLQKLRSNGVDLSEDSGLDLRQLLKDILIALGVPEEKIKTKN